MTVRCHFSAEDVELFADASHDRNPLHTSDSYARKTPFGRPVVHGMLAMLRCLAEARSRQDEVPVTMTVDFANPIFPQLEYTLVVEEDADKTRFALNDGRNSLLAAQVSYRAGPHNRFTGCNSSTAIQEARDVQTAQLKAGKESRGRWSADVRAMEDLQQRLGIAPTDHDPGFQSALLAVSYLVGMILPGRQALFSKLTLHFPEGDRLKAIDGFDYRLRVSVFQPVFGFVVMKVDLDSNGTCFASGEIRAFYRQPSPERSDEWDRVLPLGHDLEGKVALVIGGSRGLGAATVTALVRRGANVFLNFAESVSDAERLRKELESYPGHIALARGDAGDATCCSELRTRIEREYGRLDVLICNACPSLLPMWVEVGTASRIQQYINQSVQLALNPMSELLPLIESSAGTIVLISSVAVELPVGEWPHYIAAKSALEGLGKAIAVAHRDIDCLIVRPSRLDTDLTNTPLGRKGAMSTAVVAAKITEWLSENEAGR